MHAYVWDPATDDAAAALDAIVCQEVTIGGRRAFHKGHRVATGDLDLLARAPHPLHLVRLDAHDVHEDTAAVRIARALAGDGLELTEPRQSRVNAVATHKGLLRVDRDRLIAANRLPGIGVFSLPDRLAVLPGTVVAGMKITPVAVPEATLRSLEAIAAGPPVLTVKPFRPLRVGVVTTEGLEGRLRDRFRETVRAKIGWYGGEVTAFIDLPSDSTDVAGAIAGLIDDGAGLILTGGGNTIDPLDPALLALPAIDAEMVKFGAPAHPGSMFWLAYRGDVPIFNLASCSMYANATSADLVLPWIMAGERVTLDDVAELGVGGLLEGKAMAYRFPPYDRAAADPGE